MPLELNRSTSKRPPVSMVEYFLYSERTHCHTDVSLGGMIRSSAVGCTAGTPPAVEVGANLTTLRTPPGPDAAGSVAGAAGAATFGCWISCSDAPIQWYTFLHLVTGYCLWPLRMEHPLKSGLSKPESIRHPTDSRLNGWSGA